MSRWNFQPISSNFKFSRSVAEKDSDEDFGPALPPAAESTPAPSKKDRPKKLRNMEAELDMFATDDINEEE